MMGPFEKRLRERLAYGQEKHGAASYGWPASELVRCINVEIADITGWAWVLHARAAGYPEEHAREGVMLAALSASALSIRCWRIVATLWRESTQLERCPEWTPRPMPTLEEAVAWCSAPSPVAVGCVDGGRVVDGWAQLVTARAAAGQAIYGGESFERLCSELCLELGDEACAVAGWAWIMDQQLAIHGGAVRERWAPTLQALAATAQSVYHRVRAAELACVVQDGHPMTGPNLRRKLSDLGVFLAAIRAREAHLVTPAKTL